MVIAVGFSYFDNLATVMRAVKSFVDKVDYVIAVYGMSPGMTGDKEEFADTKAYLATFPNVIIKECHATEYEKRNVYVEECERLGVDTLMIIDSDEWIEGDWDLFRQNLAKMFEKYPDQTIFGMKGTINRKGDWSWYPKIWHNPEQQRYYKSHCVFKKGTTIYHSRAKESQQYLIDGLVVWHNDDLRGKDLTKRFYNYQLQLMKDEEEIRSKYK